MDEINEFIEKYNTPLDIEGVKKVILNTFAIIIFLIPILPEIIGMGVYSLKNTIFNLTTFSVVIVLGIIGVVQRNFKINVYSILTGIYVILVTVSCFMSEFGLKNNMWGNCGRGEGLVTIFSYIITFLIFTHNYKCLKKSIKIAIIGSIGVAVYATLQANFNISYSLLNDTAAKGVAKGTMMNQNFLSSYICIFLPMMCYYYINTKGEKMLIVIALLFSTLMYSKTLGGYITFVFMALCICAISVIYSNKLKDTFSRILKLLLTIVITFVIITFISGDAYVNEIKATKVEVENLATNNKNFGSGRMIIWKTVLNVIDNNKLFGVGLDSLYQEIKKDEYRNQMNSDFLDNYTIDKAHSEPLHIAATTGIPSMLVYLAIVSLISLRLLLIVNKSNIKLKRNTHVQNELESKSTIYYTMITISILSYLMQSMINISVVQVAPVFWAILGLGAGITLEEKQIN